MKRFLVVFLAALIFTGAVVVPQPAHAQLAVHDPINGIIEAGTKVLTSGISNILGNLTSDYYLKEYVLDGIAWSVSQAALQAITGSVVNFVNGKGSGGSPLYVQNLSQYLGAVADNQALNFFAEIGTQSNSPFAAAIASSLRTNYLQSSSAAGFWAANSCTLSQSSSNINSFLAGGNFSQNGGWGAWFSLTTQPQNNPYSLYYRTQAELASRVSTAQTQKSAQLAFSQGFLSWCSTSAATAANNSLAPVQVTSAVTSPTKGATNPGDPCTNSDGSTGIIQTPGSVIASSLNTSLGSGVNKLVAADELDETLGSLAANLISNVIGGASNGLFGLSQTNSSGSSYTQQLAAENPQGSTAAGAGTANYAITTAQTAVANAAAYQTAWNTIGAAAQTASSSVQAVIACENKNDSGSDPFGALPALNTEIAPIVAQAATAQTNVSNLDAMATQVENDANSTASGAAGALTSDLQTLAAMPPSTADTANAQTDAMTSNAATSTSATSLSVSGGTTVDQMNLIATGAANALNKCQNPQTSQ